jgi:hypothetical protein
MKDIIVKMIWESVWEQITNEFYEFTVKHSETLTEKEKLIFVDLVNQQDEYSHLVLESLWAKFEVENCTEERLQEIFESHLKKIGSISI